MNTLNLMRRRAPSDWAAVAPSTLSFPEARRAQAPVYQPGLVNRGTSQVSRPCLEWQCMAGTGRVQGSQRQGCDLHSKRLMGVLSAHGQHILRSVRLMTWLCRWSPQHVAERGAERGPGAQDYDGLGQPGKTSALPPWLMGTQVSGRPQQQQQQQQQTAPAASASTCAALSRR